MKKTFLFFALSAHLFFISSCQNIVFWEAKIFSMNTVFDVMLYQGTEEDLKYIKEKIYFFNDLFDSDNESTTQVNLAKLNHSQEGLKIPEELFKILKYSKELYSFSDGYFNVMMKEVNDAWKKGFEENTFPVFDEEDFQFNIDHIVLNEADQSAQFLQGVQIDLGGIAKGYTLNFLKSYLKERKIEKYYINAGTSSITLGTYQDGREFKVHIKNPNGGFIETFELKDIQVSTSGNYTQYMEKDQRKYHHIINPYTLMSENYFQSITVIYEDAMIADILSTFLFNLKKEEHSKYLNKLSSVKVLYLDVQNQIYRWGY